MDGLVDFITDVVVALFDEDNFVNIIKLLEDECASSILDWFKSLQNIDHEVLILKVVP